MLLEDQELRERTLANNLVWLQSFGCQVERQGDVIYVDHPELSDYCALLLFADPERSYEAFRQYVSDGRDYSSSSNIYVDKKAASPQLERLLTLRGCAKTSVSYVTAGEWKREEGDADVRIRAAQPEQADEWSSVYSLGFGRVAEEKMLDRRRWRKSFLDGNIHHWFFTKQNEVVGVCQTCAAHGVIGIYSFTLIPDERKSHRIHDAIHALRAKLTEGGQVNVYFERVKDRRSRPLIIHSKKSLTGFKVIRVAEAYQCDAVTKAVSQELLPQL